MSTVMDFVILLNQYDAVAEAINRAFNSNPGAVSLIIEAMQKFRADNGCYPRQIVEFVRRQIEQNHSAWDKP